MFLQFYCFVFFLVSCLCVYFIWAVIFVVSLLLYVNSLRMNNSHELHYKCKIALCVARVIVAARGFHCLGPHQIGLLVLWRHFCCCCLFVYMLSLHIRPSFCTFIRSFAFFSRSMSKYMELDVIHTVWVICKEKKINKCIEPDRTEAESRASTRKEIDMLECKCISKCTKSTVRCNGM